MTAVALIPARLGATRFPGKLLATLGGKTVIRRTYESVAATRLFDDVLVVCDSEAIEEEIVRHGGRAVRSTRSHDSGTDRIAEVAESLAADVVLNVQGDTPFTQREPLERLLAVFADRAVRVGSLMRPLADPALVANPNCVKVVVDQEMNALFFSRSPIPYLRDRAAEPPFYEHVGVYAFRREALLTFAKLAPGPLERAEKIEALRYLEHGMGIRMVITEFPGVEIDTPDDLARAEQLL
ncbi:MAG TPA: 3-deoxy-manno-octulosonate cytidylyltransferase [Gemmatimonadales bacterium]|nr:3-deoxy-manno-octulosonate cytidylyltransferase [Gemmatimonadales bacterium]